MDDAQTPFFTQIDDALGQVSITDATAELSVENVDSYLPQRITVNIFYSTAQLLSIEQGPLDLISIALESFAGPEAGPRGPP
jgi:hypothetical protein